MRSLRMLICGTLLCAGFLPPALSHAGPYADDMAKCLVKSSSPADRAVFIRYMFVAIAQHPDVQSLVKIPPKQLDDTTKSTAELIQRLMTESCRSETQQALRFEGPQTVFYAFQVFGQAAAVELFSDPHVAEVTKQTGKYLDAEKIKSLVNPSGAAGAAAPPPQAEAASPAKPPN